MAWWHFIPAVIKGVNRVAGDTCPHCGNKSLWNQSQQPDKESIFDKLTGKKSVFCGNCKRWFKVKK